MAEAQHAAAARAATPEGALACAPARDHAHSRSVLYLCMGVRSPTPRRHIRRDLVGTLRRRLGEPDSSIETAVSAHTIAVVGEGHQQVRSHRDPGLAGRPRFKL